MIIFKIDEMLEKKNKTKYWLARETGMSDNNVGNICKNKVKQVKLETLDKICVALDCELQDIITFKKDVD